MLSIIKIFNVIQARSARNVIQNKRVQSDVCVRKKSKKYINIEIQTQHGSNLNTPLLEIT